MATLTVGLAGDTMLGRKVGDLLRADPAAEVFTPGVRRVAAEADLLLCNLECCLSEGGAPWPDPHKAFFFRGPPHATRVLQDLGATAVTLANNHALDFGPEALLDTLDHLQHAGIEAVGAGRDQHEAWTPLRLRRGGLTIEIVAATDHPAQYAAREQHPGVAYLDLWHRRAERLEDAVRLASGRSDLVLVTPHWGPNMTRAPVEHVRWAADRLLEAGAHLVAGHSAHVFHGVRWAGPADDPRCVLYDLGDLVDDYAVDPALRNDLGVLWLVHIDDGRLRCIEAIPLCLEYRRTRLADGADRDWIARRLTEASAELGSSVEVTGDRCTLRPGGSPDRD